MSCMEGSIRFGYLDLIACNLGKKLLCCQVIVHFYWLTSQKKTGFDIPEIANLKLEITGQCH